MTSFLCRSILSRLKLIGLRILCGSKNIQPPLSPKDIIFSSFEPSYPGNSSSASYFPLNILAIETPLPLRIPMTVIGSGMDIF